MHSLVVQLRHTSLSTTMWASGATRNSTWAMRSSKATSSRGGSTGRPPAAEVAGAREPVIRDRAIRDPAWRSVVVMLIGSPARPPTLTRPSSEGPPGGEPVVGQLAQPDPVLALGPPEEVQQAGLGGRVGHGEEVLSQVA